MKYFFGVSKKTNLRSSDKFIVRTTSDETNREYDNIISEGKVLKSKKIVPSWLIHFAIIALLFGSMLIFGMLQAKDGFINALNSRGWLFYLGIVFVIAGASILIIAYVKNKKARNDVDILNYASKTESFINKACLELNIPLDSPKIDVVFALVKENKKRIESIDKWSLLQYMNTEMFIFIEENFLCFGDHTVVIKIPLSSIKNIEEVTKKLALPKWNKNEDIHSEKYKQYKIKLNSNMNLLYVKPYYKVVLDIDGESYYFFVPNYDIEIFKEVLNRNDSPKEE